MINDKIQFLPYTPMYKEVFLKECKVLEKVLRSNCIDVHHIGSTSIKKISSVPVLDVLCVAHTLGGINLFEDEFNKLRLFRVKEDEALNRFVFERRSIDDDTLLSRIYIYEKGDARIDDTLDFRDYLNKNEEIAKKFEADKLEFSKDAKSYHSKKVSLIEILLKSI